MTELPSGQLPVSPAIMCWEKLVENLLRHEVVDGAEGAQGSPELLPVLAKLLHHYSHSLLLFFGWEGAVAQGM